MTASTAPAAGHELPALCRHAEVSAALHEARLLPAGQTRAEPAHLAVRAALAQALAPARLAGWHDRLVAQARARVDALDDGTAVDLVAALARPWALDVALLVTGAPREQADDCSRFAHRLYQAAATSSDGSTPAEALSAATGLAQLLAASADPAAPGAGLADVQTFVALSQTLPALLAGAWLALLREPVALQALLDAPERVVAAAGELLRLGGPAQVVFRQAGEELTIGSIRLQRGERVALRLAAANRDAARFADPERLDLARDASAQLSLGGGAHACAGAALVRAALVIATQALLERTRSIALVDSSATAVEWHGGHALRAPAALWVVRRARR